MQIAPNSSTVIAPLRTRPGVPVAVLAGADRATGSAAPMQVFTRGMVGRYDGYSSLATAVNAATRLSRGSDKAAVAITRGATGMYEVREAVWQLLGGRYAPPSERAYTRTFHFEDGTFSKYSAVRAGQPLDVVVDGTLASVTGSPVILVDGARVIEAG